MASGNKQSTNSWRKALHCHHQGIDWCEYGYHQYFSPGTGKCLVQKCDSHIWEKPTVSVFIVFIRKWLQDKDPPEYISLHITWHYFQSPLCEAQHHVSLTVQEVELRHTYLQRCEYHSLINRRCSSLRLHNHRF